MMTNQDLNEGRRSRKILQRHVRKVENSMKMCSSPHLRLWLEHGENFFLSIKGEPFEFNEAAQRDSVKHATHISIRYENFNPSEYLSAICDFIPSNSYLHRGETTRRNSLCRVSSEKGCSNLHLCSPIHRKDTKSFGDSSKSRFPLFYRLTHSTIRTTKEQPTSTKHEISFTYLVVL